jgi:hypothetical protein
MIKTVYTLQISGLDFQVLLSGVQRPVPEKLGDIRDIDIMLKKVRR